MKKSITYVLQIATALLMACGCERHEPESWAGERIIIGASLADAHPSKAFLNAVDLQQDGTQVQIYDDITGFTGTIDGVSYTADPASEQTVNYIDDVIACSSGSWSFSSGVDWRWTRTGVHHFYGWLKEDKDGLHNNGTGTTPTYNSTTQVLSVPAITFDKDTPQFDFSYSDKLAVDVESSSFNAAGGVNLSLNHLFCALGVSIQNTGDDSVNIVSVTFNGLKNSRSANIVYSAENTSVNTGEGTGDTQFLSNWNGPLAPGGTKIDLVSGTSIASADSPACYLMWPQSAEEIADASISVSYTIDDVMDPSDPSSLQLFNKVLSLSDSGYFLDAGGNALGMVAGKRYFINLLFKAKTLDLTLRVAPWDYTEFDLDYSSSSISARGEADNEGVIWLYTISYDEHGDEMTPVAGPRDRLITLGSNQKIKGTFNIGSPQNGQWQITTYPAEAAQYYTLEPSSGEITEDLVRNNNGLVVFYIYPNGAVPYQQTLHLNIAFRFNGESQWRDGNTEFNRKDWRIIREP